MIIISNKKWYIFRYFGVSEHGKSLMKMVCPRFKQSHWKMVKNRLFATLKTTNLLSFSDPHPLTFFLTYILTVYLAFHLAFYLTYILTFYLASFLQSILTFYLVYLRVQACSTGLRSSRSGSATSWQRSGGVEEEMRREGEWPGRWGKHHMKIEF